ncbi:P-loop containing nucleoside triphosphate hydrolase protein, partial [Ochromonadaceae sp. CCMP2298]
RRTKGSTSMNTTSSRSHAICTISLRVSGGGAGVTAKLHLVDLAGSEGLEGAEGLSRKEGISINQGLLTLRMVVSARALKSSGKGGQGPAPYRESKLTHLLKDALGDNALTVLLACVS